MIAIAAAIIGIAMIICAAVGDLMLDKYLDRVYPEDNNGDRWNELRIRPSPPAPHGTKRF
jgi:hypothetical protein